MKKIHYSANFNGRTRNIPSLCREYFTMKLNFQNKRKILLVFIYTKYHQKILENIINLHFGDHTKIIVCCPRGGGWFLRTVKAIKSLLMFFLCRVLICVKNADILLPHPEHLFGNYFFFSKNIKNIYLYEDGLMNYIDVRLVGSMLNRSKKRRLIALALSYKYRIIKTYLSGCNENVIHSTFIRFPKSIMYPERHGNLIDINCAGKKINGFDKNCAIFIDQDIESQYGKEKALMLRKIIYSKMANIPCVFFKMHHDYLENKFDINIIPTNFKLLSPPEQKKPVELLIEKIKPGSVWGFYSTALVNIANEYNDIKCFSCVLDTHVVKTCEGEMKFSEFLSNFNVSPV